MKRTVITVVTSAVAALTVAAQANGFGQQPTGFPQQDQSGFGQQQPTGFPQQQPGGFPQQPSGPMQPAMPGFQPPGQIDVSKLGGRWMFSSQQGNDQVPWQIQVSPNGQFQGTQGKSRLMGQFNGPMGEAQMTSVHTQTGRPLQPVRVQLQFDGQCHIQMTMFNPRGGQPFQGVFHVNHQAGQPCPR